MAYKFLIIDDSNITRKVLVKTLGMTNLPVDTIDEAEHGQIGLDKLKDNWVDLIFLDINMPVMNGVEFLEKLRADDTLKDLPVVIVSTEGSQERIKRLEELGISGYLRKPTTPELLTSTVLGLLEGK
jgi:two-component system chemotaxis response regulator CheY